MTSLPVASFSCLAERTQFPKTRSQTSRNTRAVKLVTWYKIRPSDWSIQKILQSDWLVRIPPPYTTGNSLCKSILIVKHRTFVAESSCSIFLPYGLHLEDFFSAAFAVQNLFLKIAQSLPQKDNCFFTFCLFVLL